MTSSSMFSRTRRGTKGFGIASLFAYCLEFLSALVACVPSYYRWWDVPKILKTIRLDQSFVVQRGMNRFCNHNEIAEPVVCFYSIDMVNTFSGPEWSPKVSGHYKNMFSDVSALVGIGMVNTYKSVTAFAGKILAPIPVGVVYSSPASFWASHSRNLQKNNMYCVDYTTYGEYSQQTKAATP